jgi:transposase
MKNDTGKVSSRKAVSVGIDLGDEFAYWVALDERGEVIGRGQVRMTAVAMRKTFRPMAPARMAIEAGAQSRWVSRLLGEMGHEVIVANPRQVKLISASQSKSDPNDALLLARLARVDPVLLAPVKHRSDEAQMDLTMIRARALLVEQRVALMHAIRGVAKTFGVRVPRGTRERFVERTLEALPDGLRLALGGLFGAMLALNDQIEAYDEKIEQVARERYPQTQRMRGVPGIGTLTALSFVLTMGEAERFGRSRDVGGYLGLRPRQQQSGERDPQLGITKAGDRYVRKLLVQSAHCVLRKYAPDTALNRWGLKLCERGGKNAKKRAIVAVARKLAVLLHKLWVSGESYRAFPVAQAA